MQIFQYVLMKNGTYWLLDEEGKKVYFSDLETFESALTKCGIDINNIENTSSSSKTIIDIDKFITELSYSSTSTVHNSNYGGDGYRSDNYFFNNDLTKNSFSITNEGNDTRYSITVTNERRAQGIYAYPITLEILVTNDNILKEIKINCIPPNMKASGIFECAAEVEDALGYTLINARNYQIVDKVKKELKLENYISSNEEVIKKNQSITVYDENENKTITFTIGENNLEYKMIF